MADSVKYRGLGPAANAFGKIADQLATSRHLTPKSEQNVHLQVQIENDDPMLRHAVLESDEDTKRKESVVVIPPQEVTPEKNACRQAKLQ